VVEAKLTVWKGGRSGVGGICDVVMDLGSGFVPFCVTIGIPRRGGVRAVVRPM
jgi:hypothetical protein